MFSVKQLLYFSNQFLKQLWGIKFEWDLLAGDDEYKWILLAGGSTIVSFLVILTVTFVICCQWCRRSRMTSKRTPPNCSDSVFSGQSENVYEEPDSEPRTTTTHSSGAPVSNQNSRKTNANTTQSNKKKRQLAHSQKSGMFLYVFCMIVEMAGIKACFMYVPLDSI